MLQTDEATADDQEVQVSANVVEDDDDKRKLKFETLVTSDSTLDSVLQKQIIEEPTLQLQSQRQPMTDEHKIGQSESVSQYEETPSSQKASSLDEKQKAGSSEKSSAFDRSADSASSADVHNDVVNSDRFDKGGSEVSAFHKEMSDNDVPPMSETDEATVRDHDDEVREDVVDVDDENRKLKFETLSISNTMLDAVLDKPMTEQPIHELQLHRQPMTDDHQIGQSESASQYVETAPLQKARSLDEKQKVGSSEISGAFDRSVDNALPADVCNYVAVGTKDTAFLDKGEFKQPEARATQELSQPHEEERDEPIAPMSETDKSTPISQEADIDEPGAGFGKVANDKHKLKLETSVTSESTFDTVLLNLATEESTLQLQSQRQPMTDEHKIGQSELVSQYEETLLSQKALSLDEKQKAGSS
ncbi:unnamed protein product, partial [Mesocestoides corti]